MVRVYKKKTNRANISENDMECAVKQILRKHMSERQASIQFNVKRGTLHSRIQKLKQKYTPLELSKIYEYDDSGNESIEDHSNVYSSKYTVWQVFSNEQEAQLVSYIKTCSNMNYGLTYLQIRTLAFEYASALPNCKYPNKWNETKKAGIDWLRAFMRRNKNQISLRKPENTSLARATGFNKTSVAEFFKNYAAVIKKHNFKPEQIFNLDETGVTTVMKPVKVVSTKGKKQVSQAASAERGELITLVCIINAAGVTLPPVYVFPRIRHPEEYLINSPTSSIALGNRSGWMTSDLFPKVLEHIQRQTNCSTESKILIMLDNHESHISIESINFCRKHGMVMLSFPPPYFT